MSNETKRFTVPILRFPDFRDTRDWSIIPMGELFDFISTNSLSRDKLNYESGLVKNIHYGDIHTKFKTLFKIEDEHVPFINRSESLDKVKSQSYCAEGDVIFADASEDLTDIGKSIELISLKKQKLLSGLHTILARPKEKSFAPGFPGYLFKSSSIRNQIQKEAQGAKVLGISAKKLASIKLYFPTDKNEQIKVAECLSSLDELIHFQITKLELLKNYKRGLLKQLIPQKSEAEPQVRFPEFKKSGAWSRFSIKQLVDHNIIFPPQDGNHGEIHPKSEDYVPAGIPFVMANNIRNGRLDFSSCKYITEKQANSLRKGFAKEGDVLLTHKGTLGEVAIVQGSKFPFIMLTPQVTYYRIKDKTKLHNVFFSKAISAPEYQNNLKAMSGGGTRAYVGITEQSKLEIAVPPSTKEQVLVADCLETIDELIFSQSESLEILKLHMKGLLQQLFPVLVEETDV